MFCLVSVLEYLQYNLLIYLFIDITKKYFRLMVYFVAIFKSEIYYA